MCPEQWVRIDSQTAKGRSEVPGTERERWSELVCCQRPRGQTLEGKAGEAKEASFTVAQEPEASCLLASLTLLTASLATGFVWKIYQPTSILAVSGVLA